MTSDVPPAREGEHITPDWPAPANVRSLSTTRRGGTSEPPWDSFNLGDHVGDSPEHVAENRRELSHMIRLREEKIGWLRQIHSTHLVQLPGEESPEADASITSTPGTACAILTADCLPVLFCNQRGTRVAAAHAGWRGLCEGILEKTAEAMGDPQNTLAWLGPAIGPNQFEVGPEVREAFLAHSSQASQCFTSSPHQPGHYMASLYDLARQRLGQAGITHIYGGNYCTVSDPQSFYSYRRDGKTGRMATLIWLAS